MTRCFKTEHWIAKRLSNRAKRELRRVKERPMAENVCLNSIKDIIARTGLSRSTVYEEMDSGRLRSVKVGRRRLIPESALIDYINSLIGATTQTADFE